MPDFSDITDPIEFLPQPTTPWGLYAGASVLLLLLTSLLVYAFLRRHQNHRRHHSHLDHARARLTELRRQADSTPPHLAATQLSLILRRYLAAAFDDPALFETNEEFCLRESALAQLHPDSRHPVSLYLSDLSQIKYVPQSAIPVSQLIDQAETVIANIEINVGDAKD